MIAQSGLATWVVTADAAWSLSRRIQTMPGVEQVALFGATLHVSGRNADALASSMRMLADEGLSVKPGAPGLEDVFIDLMQGVKQ